MSGEKNESKTPSQNCFKQWEVDMSYRPMLTRLSHNLPKLEHHAGFSKMSR